MENNSEKFKPKELKLGMINQETADIIHEMSIKELESKSKEELIEILGPPTWSDSTGNVGWKLHPYIWDGELSISSDGEVMYCYDQGGAI